MADMVVINGIQYPADKIPDGVDGEGALSAEEWYKKNRVAAPVHKAEKPEASRSSRPVKSK